MRVRYLAGLIVTLGLMASSPVLARDFFIDYANGSDANDGQSRESAWKHAPGDPNATQKAGRYTPKAGDVFLFRGGVEYLGSITVPAGGNDGNPVTYKGNGWGEERARLSGAARLDVTFAPCSSAEDCYGNENWKNLFKTQLPEKVNPLTPMYFGGERVWLARDPNQPDPFWFDDYDHYHDIGGGGTEMTHDSVILGQYFDHTPDINWENAIIAVWMKPNLVLLTEVTGVDRVRGTIKFAPPGNDPYTDRESYFALFNRPSDIDTPGEYFVDNKRRTLLIWPKNSDAVKDNDLRINKLAAGFILNGQDNVVVEGFHISHYFGDHDEWYSGTAIINFEKPIRNAVIRDNVIDNLRTVEGIGAIQLHKAENAIVEKNVIVNSQKSSGIRYGYTTNSIIRDNVIRKIGRTGIRLIETENIQISGNHLSDILGVHGNGISVYLKNRNILIADNILENVPFAFTYHGTGNVEEANNMWLLNNVFMGRVRSWGSAFDKVYFLHNLAYAEVEPAKAIHIPGEEPRTTLKNNIIDGLIVAPPPSDWALESNLYTSLAWVQSSKYDWVMEPGGKTAENILPQIAGFAKKRPALRLPLGANIYSLLPVEMFPAYDFSHWRDARPVGPAFVQPR